MTDAPWDDCKVAFGVEDSDALDAIWYSDERPAWLPPSWSFDEIDTSGARMVMVFRVEGVPTIADGAAVSAALSALGEDIQTSQAGKECHGGSVRLAGRAHTGQPGPARPLTTHAFCSKRRCRMASKGSVASSPPRIPATRRSRTMSDRGERDFFDLLHALRDWPRLPESYILSQLGSYASHTADHPDDWERGCAIQRELPMGRVSFSHECEKGAGMWDRITNGAWRTVEPTPSEAKRGDEQGGGE